MNVRTLSCSALGALLWATEAMAQCVPISNVNLTPISNTTNTFNCGRTQVFTATATGSNPKTWRFTTAPGVGATAVPASATFTNSLNSRTSNHTLTRTSAARRCSNATPFSVTVTVDNACTAGLGVAKQINYTLTDTTAPNIGGRFCACDNATCIGNPAVATDNCDLNPSETFVPPERRTNLNCAGNYNLARDHNVLDCNGVGALRTLNISVRDFVAPVVTQNLSDVACMWPPNHNMVFFSNASFPIVATDNCSGIASRSLAGAVSSQPDEQPGEGPNPLCSGDGNTGPDVAVVSGGLNLRSERCGDATHPDEGRDYAVQGFALDGCGNRSQNRTVGIVSVPHDSDDQTSTECISAE